ncbi:hypothetical protein [Giesbergeria anulus]|uniref:Uncharacterized protein n=1 Tax=Giesbergeria anulus TaxID=180197 RepID=A0A1H9NHD1_9BURK|nr:hypothetical protein [Giesbergeria anulus]SER35311.1 hypothetical protein SAMN02982919_02218 [Giesbergeria anulus]
MVSFDVAKKMAEDAVKAGEIIRYAVRTSEKFGLCIEVESDSGWNPDPWWQEINDHESSTESHHWH